MKLFNVDSSPYCGRVRYFVYALNLPVDIVKQDYKDPNYRKVNPIGKVPALQLDDGQYAIEIGARDRERFRAWQRGGRREAGTWRREQREQGRRDAGASVGGVEGEDRAVYKRGSGSCPRTRSIPPASSNSAFPAARVHSFPPCPSAPLRVCVRAAGC